MGCRAWLLQLISYKTKTMKRFLMVSLVAFALSSFIAQAQEVSKDSIKSV
jgi:hypothetical protein